MKNWILLAIVSVSFSALAQKTLVPGKRKSEVMGGTQDFNEYRPFGLQFSFGPTYMMTRGKNPTYTTMQSGRPIDFTMDPAGRLGVFLEAGMLHYPTKRSKLSQRLKYIFVSYYDWGIGYKLLGGIEDTHLEFKDPFGTVVTTEDHRGKFYNGFLYGRFTLHKNIYLGKRYFIDNGLGVNVDYNITRADENSDYTQSITSSLGQGAHTFHNPFVAAMHYNLGFGIRLNRRSFFVIGAEAPILGIQEWRKGCAALKWYDSNYTPLMFRFKWTYLFKKKTKGCATAKVNDQDSDTMKKNR